MQIRPISKFTTAYFTMSNRDRIRYALLGLFVGIAIWSLWNGWHAYKSYRFEHTQERIYAAEHDKGAVQKPINFNCATLSNGVAACSAQQPDTENIDEHTKADLKAQQDVAEWTFASVLISVISMALTLIGTMALFYSLHLNRQATKAAIDSVVTSKENSRLELRAYVGGTDFKVENFLADNMPRTTWTLKNFGQTIAIDVRITAGVFVVNGKENIKLPNKSTIRGNILPGELREIPHYWPFSMSE